MNIIETVSAERYAETADVYTFPDPVSGQQIAEAYLVLGHTPDGHALVVRQRAMSEIDAVKALVTRLHAMWTIMEGAANSSFLPKIEAQKASERDQINKLRAKFGLIPSDDKDDDGEDPGSKPS